MCAHVGSFNTFVSNLLLCRCILHVRVDLTKETGVRSMGFGRACLLCGVSVLDLGGTNNLETLA
jgi:hypothetical protein